MTNPFVRPVTRTSAIPPERQQDFQAWVRRNKITDLNHPESYYDYQGAFLAGVNRGSNGHWPDTFKKPGHPTFSVESRYATGADQASAGRWNGETYIPPTTQDPAPTGNPFVRPNVSRETPSTQTDQPSKPSLLAPTAVWGIGYVPRIAVKLAGIGAGAINDVHTFFRVSSAAAPIAPTRSGPMYPRPQSEISSAQSLVGERFKSFTSEDYAAAQRGFAFIGAAMAEVATAGALPGPMLLRHLAGGAVGGGTYGGLVPLGETESRAESVAVNALLALAVTGAIGGGAALLAKMQAGRLTKAALAPEVDVLTVAGTPPSPDIPTAGARGFLRKYFTSRGNLPQDVFDRKVATNAALSADEQDVVFALRDFKRGVSEAYDGNPPAAEMARLDAALKADIPLTDIPEAMRAPVQSMRNSLDAMSLRMIDEGVIEGALVEKVQGNLGRYASRSYQVFDDPKWAEKVDESVKIKVRNLLRSENPGIPEEEVEGLLAELLHKTDDGPFAALRGAKLGAKDLSVIIKRKEIAPEIRELWGEYTDPRVNFARSMTRMARLVENHHFLNDVKASGLNTLFFEKPIVNEVGSFHVPIAAEGSAVMKPLNGLYTTPEIAEAFQNAFTTAGMPDWLRVYMLGNGVVKYAKTVGSVMSQVRNVISNTGFAVANGHWRVSGSVEATRSMLASIGIKDSAVWRTKYRRYTELGIVNESVYANELKAALNDVHKSPDFASLTESMAVRGLKAIPRIAQTGYRMGDEVWKVFAFENELARYGKALPGMPKEELERMAASVVRNTYPTYSMIPEAVTALRRFPVLGTFVSFPAEVFRTGYHTLKLAAHELKTPALRKIGAERLAGILIAASALPAAARGARGIVGMLKGEDEDMRRFLPPWSKNSTLIPFGRGTEFTYVDASFTDPYNYLREPVMAMMRGEDWTDKLLDATVQAGAPFFSEDLLTGKLLDVMRNTTKQGQSVYNPYQSGPDVTWDITKHLWEGFEPGTATSLRRILNMGQKGPAKDPAIEALAMVSGVRFSKLDVPESLRFKVREYQAGIESGRGELSGTARRPGASMGGVIGAFHAAEEIRREAFDRLTGDLAAARRMGMTAREVRVALEAAGLSGKDIRNLMSGRYEVYKPTDQFLEDAKGRVLNVEERRREIQREARRMQSQVNREERPVAPGVTVLPQ